MIDRHGETFLDRVFTRVEIDYCGRHKSASERYAGHFAAKEAVLKALGTGWGRGISWHDVEIRHALTGAPLVVLTGEAREHARRNSIERILLSLSHCRTHATATALALDSNE